MIAVQIKGDDEEQIRAFKKLYETTRNKRGQVKRDVITFQDIVSKAISKLKDKDFV